MNMIFVCQSCGEVLRIKATFEGEAIKEAVGAGWYVDPEEGTYICPCSNKEESGDQTKDRPRKTKR